jgi:hypothetical protein
MGFFYIIAIGKWVVNAERNAVFVHYVRIFVDYCNAGPLACERTL